MKANQEVRRYKDIMAFRSSSEAPALAFHSRNLEVAEISETFWNSLQETSVQEAVWKSTFKKKSTDSIVLQNEMAAEIENWNQEDSADVTQQDIKFKIKTLTLNITQICNLHCHYCAAGGDGTYGDPVRQISVEKTLPQIRFFLEQLPPGDQFHLIFLGGEPLLYPEAIRGIASYTKELAESRGAHATFNIITNGTLINTRFVELMKDLKPSITFSMDGDPQTNDLARPQRNGQGSSKAALAGLQILREHRESFSEIGIHSVFTKKNLKVLKAYEFFAEFNVDHFEFTFDIFETDSASNQEFIRQMQQVAALAFARGGETELRKIAMYNSYFTALDDQTRRMNHCGSGKSLLSLSSRNQIFTCPLEVSHSAAKVGVDTDLNYDQLETLQKPLIELNDCGNCWARHLCGGGCMYSHKAATGNPHQKHPSYCERTRSLIIDALTYYKLTRA